MFTQHKPECLWGINPIGKFNEDISLWKAAGGFGLLVLHVLQQKKTTSSHWVKSIGNALSQRGNFYIIYISSNSAESASNCWIVLIPYLKGSYWELWKWINQWPLADIRSIVVNINCSNLFSNSFFFSLLVFPADLLSFYFWFLSFLWASERFASSALTDQCRLVLCQHSDLCLCSERWGTFMPVVSAAL